MGGTTGRRQKKKRKNRTVTKSSMCLEWSSILKRCAVCVMRRWRRVRTSLFARLGAAGISIPTVSRCGSSIRSLVRKRSRVHCVAPTGATMLLRIWRKRPNSSKRRRLRKTERRSKTHLRTIERSSATVAKGRLPMKQGYSAYSVK